MTSFAPNAVQDRRLNTQQQPYQSYYQQNEQEKKPQPQSAQQPQAPQAPQQPAQPAQAPQTTWSARESAPEPAPTFRQMREAGQPRPPAPQGGADMFASSQGQAPQGAAMGQQSGGPPDVQSAMSGYYQPSSGPVGAPTGQVQLPSSAPNGFNGAAPNFNPLDYYIGQAMGVGAPQAPQFQQYTPQSAPGVKQAGTYSAPGINFQASAPGVDTNVEYNPVDVGQAGTFAGGTGIGGAAEAQVRNVLNKPSGWDSELLRSLYGTQGAEIDDQFAARDTAINEEMAGRGLYDSSIAAGRLKDSNIEKRDAKTRLSDSLLQQMGLNLGADNARAAGVGTNYQSQQFAEGRGTFEANEQAKRAVVDQQMQQAKSQMEAAVARGELSARQAQMSLEAQRMNLEAQQYGATNSFNAAQLNSSNINNYNNAAINAAQLGQQDRQFGITSNNNNAQQTFNNGVTTNGLQRDAAGNIVNMGQQQFNNDMTQAQFNALLQQQQWQQALAAMGLR